MLTKEVMIRNASGLHVRPAQMFTEKAATFQSKINVLVKRDTNDIEIDGKSILGLLTLGLEKGSVIKLSADGPDAQEALDVLEELINNGFGED